MKSFLKSIGFISVLLAGYVSASAQGAVYKTLGGSEIQIDLKEPDKPVLLVFWASWCKFCVAEIPEIHRAAKFYPEIEFLGVNLDLEVDDGLKVHNSHNLKYSSIFDPKLVVADMYGIKGTPGFVLLGTKGEILHQSTRITQELKNALSQASKEVF